MSRKRAYEASHPWITFRADLRPQPARFWLLLGEAIARCEHIAGVPLKPAVARDLNRIYLAKGVHATTAIEGNTLSEEDVLKRIAGEKKLPASKEYLGREVDNILAACNDLVLKELAAGKDVRLTPERVRQFNRVVLAGLELEEGVVPGEIRRYEVGVGRYKAAPPEDCEYLLERLCDFLDQPQVRSLEGASRAIVLSVLAHLYIAWIHPFADGNGRTARLVEFQLLVSAGVPAPAAHLLSDHYNETCTRYYRELDFASRSKGDICKFLVYALEGFVDGLRSQHERIRRHQWDVAWENFVHEVFGDAKKRSATDLRRIRLALDLSRVPEPVPYDEVARVSTRVAEAYGGRTRRTLSRDLNVLIRRKLVERTSGGAYRALKENVLAFLPLSKGPLIEDVKETGGAEERGPVFRLGEDDPDEWPVTSLGTAAD